MKYKSQWLQLTEEELRVVEAKRVSAPCANQLHQHFVDGTDRFGSHLKLFIADMRWPLWDDARLLNTPRNSCF
ncbi:hypothetical protein TNIN_443221 [Trichonephila inaurata madagascariensis]|uniref:Uncharacterized protein n=1 Tax=Trichonephila inaurata madagascariensis TaxID=2747483 RepID=A0A8X6XDE1_9ARAC|nr:hypothetical protein TNIN_443221 [Trichonephila inaurata madagascariensis]